MTLHLAINGLGRVGRALLRIARERDDLAVVAVNDRAEPATLARLVAHDSLHGPFAGTVSATTSSTAGSSVGGALVLDGEAIPLFRHREPGSIPWSDTGARVVVEATGRFRSREAAAPHLGGSVEHVVISATADDADATFVVGVNQRDWDPKRHRVVSNASCTTNCLVPVLAVLDRAVGVEHALFDTVHCYTNSQQLMDFAHPDPRRARAAAMNIIPTTSDAVEALPRVLPRLAGRVRGLAYRVPVPDGSLVDLTAVLARDSDAEELADVFRTAASGELAGILGVTEEELVSVDFIGSPLSATVDLPLLETAGPRLARVVAWYDNEWGYAHRLADLLAWIGHGGENRDDPTTDDPAEKRP